MLALLVLASSTEAFVYWTDPQNQTIGRASIDGTGVDDSFIGDVPGVCGLATDDEFLYWGNSQLGTIGRATLDGNGVDQNLIGGGLGTCGVSASGTSLAWANYGSGDPSTSSIGIGSANGTFVKQDWVNAYPYALKPLGTASYDDGAGDVVYWLNGDGALWSAPFDSSVINPLVAPNTDLGGGIAVSGTGIYWADPQNGRIIHANPNGSGLSTLVTGLGNYPCGVAVDDTYLYWGDAAHGTIGRAQLNGSSPNPSFIHPGGNAAPCWVGVDPDTAAASVSPPSLDFGDVLAGPGPTPQLTVTLTNSASTTVDLVPGFPQVTGPDDNQLLLSGDTCGSSLAPGASCGVSVDFAPTSVGGKSATLSIPSNDPDDNPIEVPLSGTGVAPNETVSPSSIPFGHQLVDTVSAQQTVTLTNGPGASAPDVMGQVTLTGPDAAEFDIESDGCSNTSVPVDDSCQVWVSFAPSAVGGAAASLSIPSDDSFADPATVALSGFGTDADEAVLPASLEFGEQQLGQASATRQVTVANSADATGPLAVGSVSLGGANPSSYDLVSDQCSGHSVSPGDRCNLGIRFAPAATGVQTAAVQIPSNGSASPVGVAVSGTGIQAAAPPAPVPTPNTNPFCHRLRVKLKKAKSKKKRKALRKKLKRHGC